MAVYNACLFNAVCLYNANLFYTIIFANAFCFNALSLGYRRIVCLLQIVCIIYSVFNQLVFLILGSHRFYI